MTTIAVNSESGMAVAEMNAVRTLNKKTNKIEMTNVEPIRMSALTLSIAVSIKLAGLNKS